MAIRKVSYEVEVKRPEWATPGILKAMKDEGKTLREIGVIVGLSAERVRVLIKKALEKEKAA